MSKEMTKKTSEEDALAQWRQQNSKSSGSFNYIKLVNQKFDPKTEKKNPNYGKIFAHSFVDGEEHIEEIQVGDEFYPAHYRMQISCRDYEKDPQSDKQRAKYWCREVNMGEDIELMDADGNVVFNGQYKDAKEEYNLKYQVAIYAWYKEKLYRWKVGGGSLSSWFAVNTLMRDTGYPHSVKIGSITEKKNNAISWNDIDFELGDKFDVMTAVNLRNTVDDILSEYYQRQKMATESASNGSNLSLSEKDDANLISEPKDAEIEDNEVGEDLPF